MTSLTAETLRRGLTVEALAARVLEPVADPGQPLFGPVIDEEDMQRSARRWDVTSRLENRCNCASL